MDDRPSNPFAQSRTSIANTNPFFTFGDTNTTFFSRLKNNNKLYQSQMSFGSKKQIEASILQKYQKEIYSMDSQGHCLAESLLDEMITEDGDKKQDFWQKIKALSPKKQLRNPFGATTKASNSKPTSSFSNKGNQMNMRRIKQQANNKTKLHSTRVQIIKLKDIIKRQKQKQEKNKTERQTFSLANMYKAKRQNDQLNKHITDSLTERKQQSSKINQTYPPTITIKETVYHSIPI